MNPAIVIGLDCITGLQVARLLDARGVPVIGVARRPHHFACRTRACRRVLVADTAGEALVEALVRLGPTLEAPGVLYPCTDAAVRQVSLHREALRPWYLFALPDHDTVEMLMDKARFYAFARQHGLPVPATLLLHSRREAADAARQLTFPCLLKPTLKTPTWERATKAKAFRVTSPDELLALYDRCARWADTLMVQEWVEGPDHNLYSCNAYFDAGSRPLATFVSRKLRQWPIKTGTSCLGVACRHDTLLETTVRLFRLARFHGLAYLEMKQDARTGRHLIIEPNVGRPTGRSVIAEAGGVELHLTMYCDLTGRPLPARRAQDDRRITWVYLRRDLQASAAYWRRGELTPGEWWRSLRGPKVFAVWSPRDPVPFFLDVWQTAQGAARAWLRSLAGRLRPRGRPAPQAPHHTG